ncbi:OmpA family protein [bacterium]|nr:OmpA family protein [bacterium]
MARKKHHEEHENLERWLVSYADFITLLFAFFTVLYALSQQDKAKYKDVAESIQRAFMSAGGLFTVRGVPFSPYDATAEKGVTGSAPPEDQGRLSKFENDAQMDRVAQQLRGLFRATTGLALSPGSLEVIKTDKGYRIRLGEYLLFKPGSDKIKRDNIPFLYAVGKRLAKGNSTVQVEGHSDTAPFLSDAANWQLSVSRAFNVVQFFKQGVGFPSTRISLSGYGDSRPVADNATPQGRARNRRVELVVTLAEGSHEGYSWDDLGD